MRKGKTLGSIYFRTSRGERLYDNEGLKRHEVSREKKPSRQNVSTITGGRLISLEVSLAIKKNEYQMKAKSSRNGQMGGRKRLRAQGRGEGGRGFYRLREDAKKGPF